MPTETLLGMNAKLYYKVGGVAGGGAFIEMSNVKDVTNTNEKGEADVTTRANLGYRARVSTLKDVTLEFEMIDDPADDGFVAIKNAYNGNVVIGLRCLDKALGSGVEADFEIMTFSRKEALEEAITYSITAKIGRSDTPPIWIDG